MQQNILLTDKTHVRNERGQVLQGVSRYTTMDEAETSAVLPLPANQLQETWRKLLPQATPSLRQTHCRKQGCNSSLSTWPWHVTEDRLSPFLLLGWHCPMSLMSLIQGRRKEKKHCCDRTAAFSPALLSSSPVPLPHLSPLRGSRRALGRGLPWALLLPSLHVSGSGLCLALSLHSVGVPPLPPLLLQPVF